MADEHAGNSQRWHRTGSASTAAGGGALAGADGAVVEQEEHAARVVAVEAQYGLGPLERGACTAAGNEHADLARGAAQEEAVLAARRRQPRGAGREEGAE